MTDTVLHSKSPAAVQARIALIRIVAETPGQRLALTTDSSVNDQLYKRVQELDPPLKRAERITLEVESALRFLLGGDYLREEGLVLSLGEGGRDYMKEVPYRPSLTGDVQRSAGAPSHSRERRNGNTPKRCR